MNAARPSGSHGWPLRRGLCLCVAASVALGTATAFVATSGLSIPASASSSCPGPAKLTAAEQSSTIGIGPTSVTVANVSTSSGPVPGLFEGAPTGVKAYFAYVNSRGGVHGRKLALRSYDTGFSGELNESETAQAASSQFAMVGSFSLFDSYGCTTLATNPAFPDASVTLDGTTNALPNEFSIEPVAVGDGLGGLQYIRHNYPKAVKLGTIIATSPTAVSQWEGEKAALRHVGFHIVYTQKVSPLTSSFTTQVIKMRDAGTQVVYLMILDWQIAALVSQEMADQDWHPTVVLSGGPIYAAQFIQRAGGPSAVDGDWDAQAQALYLGQDAKTIPADAEFLKWVSKVNPGWTPDLYTLYGWASAQLFVQALEAAGPDPTRGSVLDQLKKITSFDASGLVAPVDPAHKTPANCILIARIEHGNFTRVKPTGAGFTCSSTFFYAPGSAAP